MTRYPKRNHSVTTIILRFARIDVPSMYLRGRLLTAAAPTLLRACLAGPSDFRCPSPSPASHHRLRRPYRFQGGPVSSRRAPYAAVDRRRTACYCCCCCAWNRRGYWTSGQRSLGRRRRRRSSWDRRVPVLRTSSRSFPGIWSWGRSGNGVLLVISSVVAVAVAIANAVGYWLVVGCTYTECWLLAT